ncbi:hypothetical protein AB0C14_11005 [Microbispora hainanensis]|uniref:hypothetical protein n=1 Tax=Microbispora hainanensis TaxID=568844 RepID=UPI0033DCFDDB
MRNSATWWIGCRKRRWLLCSGLSTLVETYASLPLGAVDASVVAVAVAVAERLGITLDRRHFTVVRPQHIGAFMLLPERL